MYRDTIIDNDDYTVDLSYEHGELFVHIDVYNYNNRVYERIVDDWLDMEEALYNEGFSRVFGMPQKLGLVTKMGWAHICDIEYRDVKQGVYLWDLRPYQY